MSGLLKQSTARNVPILMVDSLDRTTGKTGLTLTITASKDGAAFASISPTVTELSNGWYNLALTTSHTDTLGFLLLHITAANADNYDEKLEVVPDLPGNVTTVQAAATNIKKNAAFTSFMFVMTDSTTHAPKTGCTVTATRSIDGGSFASCTNSATEVANGVYKITLSASDLNGNNIMLRFTATGADDRLVSIVTQP